MSTEDEAKAEERKCILCSGDADRSDVDPIRFKCERCGEYRVQKFAAHAYKGSLAESLFPLSPVARDHWERHGQPLLITKENVGDLRSQLPREHDVTDKTQRLLRALERQTEHPGHSVEIYYDRDYPLAYAANAGEFGYYCQYLGDCGWIELHGDRGSCSVILTPKGWAEIERLRRTNVESEKVFVAMWYSKELDLAYDDGIQPAIEKDCGYKAIRVDREEYVGSIDDRIVAEIRESRFIVADLTGQPGGVYFEAGFALGLGLPVIWSCRDGDKESVHFDIRQQNRIVWTSTEDLRERLANRVRAVIGLGPNKTEA